MLVSRSGFAMPAATSFAAPFAGTDAAHSPVLSCVYSDSYANPEARMHSPEPLDRSILNLTLPTPPPSPESWRTELASRVSTYRARKNRSVEQEEQESLARGFELQAGDLPASELPAAENDGPLPGAPRKPAGLEPVCLEPVHIEPVQMAFDTNYYRRLNAHALEQSGEAAAIRPTGEPPGRDMGRRDMGAQHVTRQYAPREDNQAECHSEFEAASELPVDLDLHVPASGDACLERYRLHDEEPTNCAAAPLVTGPLDRGPLGPAPPVTAPAAACGAFGAQGNLLAFPRPLLEPPLLAHPSRDELADPVHLRPRILEVPEDIMPAMQGSLFPEIRLDLEEPETCARREPGMEIPLPVAPLSMRLKAGLADLAVVAAGGALFAAILGRTMPEPPHGKPFWVALVLVTMLLWAAYQYLFLLYAGGTVGMRMTGIRLSTFDGRSPQWTERRRRARFILISLASVALGFLWALVDEDTLCWHDRVSQTFPTTN